LRVRFCLQTVASAVPHTLLFTNPVSNNYSIKLIV
jgi:hypothetical protein